MFAYPRRGTVQWVDTGKRTACNNKRVLPRQFRSSSRHHLIASTMIRRRGRKTARKELNPRARSMAEGLRLTGSSYRKIQEHINNKENLNVNVGTIYNTIKKAPERQDNKALHEAHNARPMNERIGIYSSSLGETDGSL